MAPKVDVGIASQVLPRKNPEIAAEAPPEWLLWAKRSRMETQKLCERIGNMERTQADSTSSIKSLEKDLEQQTAKYTSLEERHSKLRQDIEHSLEKSQADSTSITKALEKDLQQQTAKHKTLENKYGQLSETDNRISQRLSAQLEDAEAFGTRLKTATERIDVIEGITRAKTNAHGEELRKVRAETNELKGLMEDVLGWKGAADNTQGKLRDEVSILKRKIGEVVADSKEREDTNKHRRAFSPFSEATTVDRPTDTIEENAIQQELVIQSQQNLSLEEYLKYGSDFIVGAMELYEIRVVKAFVQGLREKYRRTLLKKRVEKKGWRWVSANEEMTAMIEASKRNGKGNCRRRQAALELCPPRDLT